MATLTRVWNGWWHQQVPLQRWHVFRALIYLYIPLDVITSLWISNHGLVPAEWYQPLWFARELHIPAPTAISMGIATIGLLTLPFVAATGRGRRVIGPVVALLYFYWCFVAFTYGKVDHDRVALITALAVLPTAPWRGEGASERAGWGLSMVQMSFVLTYFLAGITKLLVAGPSWVTSTTIERAVARRGTPLGDLLLHVPPVMIAIQFAILLWELVTPLMILRNRLGRLFVYSAIAFHVLSLVGITIYFRSHLICVIAFLPLEKLYDWFARRRGSASDAGVVDAHHDHERHALSKE